MSGQFWLFGTDVGVFHSLWVEALNIGNTRYHIVSRIITCFITHVTILLWEFYNVSNPLILLNQYYIGYCIPHYTFLVK